MSSTTSDQAPVLVRAADAEVLSDSPRSIITLLADSDTTGGALTTNRATLRQGSDGAPPHFHTRCTEFFFILDGSLQVLLDDRVLTLERGDFLAVPPRTPHAFGAAPGADAEVLVGFTPGMDRFEYYRLLDRVARGAATTQEILDSQERFDNHYFDSPLWRETRAAG